MRTEIARLFTPELLADGATRFGISLASLQLLGDHQAYVYGGYAGPLGNVVLRITHSSHRSVEWIEAELEWIKYLTQQGVPAARPVESLGGLWVESIAGGEFLVCCFTKALGGLIGDEQLRPSLFAVLGRTLGRMHSLTKRFVPVVQRPHWFELDAYDVCRYVPTGQREFRHRALAIIRTLSDTPRSNNTYGLIHADLHFGNIFVHESTITCFDFDSCQYHWFGYDLAAIIFFSARRLGDAPKMLPGLINALLSGYSAESNPSDLLLESLELFVAVREIAKYILYFKHDRANTDSLQRQQRIVLYRSDIEQGRSFCDLDWNSFVR
jgi:amicoumacin kinase